MFINIFVLFFSSKVLCLPRHAQCKASKQGFTTVVGRTTQYMSTICAIYTALTNYEVVTDWYIHVAALDNNSPDGPDGLYTNVDEITERNCHLQ